MGEENRITIHEIEGQRILAINNEAFDWGIDEESFKKVQTIAKNDPEVKKNYIGSIQKYFVKCFSEFIGKEITLKEINQAIKRGYI